MGVYLPNMEMPKDRSRWVVIYPDGKVEYSDKTDEWETLDKGAIPVPPHGDLISRETAKLYHSYFVDERTGIKVPAIQLSVLNVVPAIIPGDKED